MPLDVARFVFAQREYRTTAPIEDLAVFTKHPLATELEYNTLLREESDANAFGLYVLELRKLDRWTWACYVNKANYSGLEIGQTITVVYPRFGLSAGKNLIVKRIKRDSNALFDELTLIGPQ
jgi:hypothetical protein